MRAHRHTTACAGMVGGGDSNLNELSPMLPHGTWLRMSHSHAAFDTELNRSIGSNVRRANSVPVLTRRDRRLLTVSPMLFDRYYMAEGGGLISSAFNLASATCGAGVLALPYAMQHCGTVTGTLTLIFVCNLTIYSVFLLAKVSALTKLMSYEELAIDLVGPITEKVTAAIIVVFCWGVAVMYIVMMGDFIVPLFEAVGLSHKVHRRTAMVLFWALVMFPLSMARKVQTLRYASIVGTVSIFLLAGALVDRFAQDRREDANSTGLDPGRHTPPRAPLARWDSGMIGALTTFVFSYCCQPVAPRIYEELKDRSVKRMCVCTVCSMTAATVIYILTGVFGAMSFGDSVKPNVLVNFSNHLDSRPAQLAYFGIVVSLTMAFPMTIFPTRDSVVMAMGYHAEENPAPVWLSRTIAGLLALLALLIGIALPNIRVLFDVLGGVCGGSLSFLLPALFALRSGYWTTAEVGWRHMALTWLTLAFGVVVCGLGTYNSVKSNFF
ncbi:amino acid permease-like protein [Leishmania donovani]|uniref:Amino_acid_permease-like_protein n=4 Tax=Leishmania donovani species complex TaxID=38574 RepID=A0A6L0XSS5_LEIIN|nr:amino acid permease-like protein [Leishmania infantum JPCM5]AYU83388.1 amino acid permease-like protein [Leishmania donovani]CAC9548794.1 amino_acid_permease-like_protein [Leishmania infantum]CAJ1993403.1 amino acid permease-like protein [Leishmania donovani]CAM72673.1 amino acid permease-like protein [Leishmania infantum JPCM5]SUZ46415.1 amino_acid_permease-like_protein [Leishmania infantum]|eukprot:XP_001469564.1 amino acid permease-like protein [Leishmania infantum JPCM5]